MTMQTPGPPDVPLDLLVVAPHPDDAELGAGGLMLTTLARGYRVGVLDLTRGEMGTKGDVADRMQERDAATRLLGLTTRIQLDLGDTQLMDSDTQALVIARVLRETRPVTVLSTYPFDRHPDHAAAARLTRRASLLARLIRAPLDLPIHSVHHLGCYFIHDLVEPHFVVDITAVFARKREVVAQYRTQFVDSTVPEGYHHIGMTNHLRDIEANARYFGRLVGVEYGEGFRMDQTLRWDDPVALWRETTV